MNLNSVLKDYFSNLTDLSNLNNLYGDSIFYYINSLIHPNKIIVVKNSNEASKFYQKFVQIFPDENICYFPDIDRLFFENTVPESYYEKARLYALEKILNSEKITVITCVRGFFLKLLPVELFKKHCFILKKGSAFLPENLGEILVTTGYERVDVVENPGEFASRGEIFDIWQPGSDYPFRIGGCFDEIEFIKKLGANDYEKDRDDFILKIFPTREVIKDSEFLTHDYDEKNNVTLENYYDNYPAVYKTQSTILDWIKNPEIILIEKNIIEKNYNTVLDELKSFDVITPKFIMDFNYLTSKHYRQISFIDDFHIKQNVNIKTVENFDKNISRLAQFVLTSNLQGYKCFFCFLNKPRLIRFKSVMEEYSVSIKDEDNLLEGENFGCVNGISEGFILPGEKIIVFGEENIWGKARVYKLKREHKKFRKSIFSVFSELKTGDYAVHIHHGIGVYKGIIKRKLGNTVKEFFSMEYKNKDMLFIPIENADFIHKYIGKENPEIYSLSGKKWQNVTKKARKKAKDIAKDMIKLYAERMNARGYVFGKDSEWQHEMEASFPFEETKDQLRVLEEIKKDMESPQPMDRLLCGDVGFGKTEVAVRAAFKAVMSGKQVAVLAPTTILVEQHHRTFTDRFKMFPLKIECVSRMKTLNQTNEIFDKLKTGEIDVVIGTHKLLSDKVQFEKLGLLIVDEEQRFGVVHKEKLKKLKKNVDVLTMTATPIPRTLNMALNGIRDISILETPPENRQPIKTYVLPFSSELLKEAIIRELEREGQVYYLHNNINTINFAAKNLQNLIPEARIGVTHGRIARGELNNLMRDFLENKLDILVTTTIIESGIDISNVNTIIVENAHRFGLSQLYQLKGRVGRSERQAHAYLFYPKGTELTENAYERLKTLKEHTELGSGFKIAMKDLEIRGSGNVFGGEQHGFMDEVGFEMYCRILKEVVGEEKGEIYEEWREIRFNIPINAYIPDYFVSSRDNKIEIYRNISLCSSYEEINSVTAELKENYGRIPEEVLNLLKIQKLKIAGRKVGLKEICEYDNNNIILKFYELHFSATGLNDFLAKFENNLNLKLNISDSVVIKKERGGVNFIFEQVEKILQYMKFCVNMRN